MKKKLTINNIKRKIFNKPLVCLTAYTTPMAQILDKYCDVILVGDSLGMVLHGMKSTREVTLEMMIMHAKAVRRGIKKSLLVVDMPIGTYEKNSKIALINARQIMKETNCDAVKVEGGIKVHETIKCLVNNDIPVMGHVGLLPQSVKKKSDYKVKGKDYLSFNQIIKDSISVEKAGAFSLVVECVIKNLADKINKSIKIPTIGIGASNQCDGQILVTEDLLGYSEKPPKFVKMYDNFKERTEICIKKFVKDLKNNNFPNFKNMYQI
ncbi:PanB Ketopantoate hydroxymethyltransferase [Candidatus Pelagibacterales bacterium]